MVHNNVFQLNSHGRLIDSRDYQNYMMCKDIEQLKHYFVDLYMLFSNQVGNEGIILSEIPHCHAFKKILYQ